MNHAQSILPEFDEEMANTRRVLELIPDDKLDWRPLPGANTIAWNASHLAEIPEWASGTLRTDSMDVHPAGGEPQRTQVLASRGEILATFDRNVAEARRVIAAASDEVMAQTWTLLSRGQPLFAIPRSAVIRTWVLNHSIHHRAHLLVYLRLCGISVPGMYGPGPDPT
jgi:uncharacterized damage-inducible protein DinB